jgi:dipeptidyl aminopeptidase/acylaminoacyl peptidase
MHFVQFPKEVLMNWRVWLPSTIVAWASCFCSDVSAQETIGFLSFSPGDPAGTIAPRTDLQTVEIEGGAMAILDHFPYEDLGPGKYSFSGYWSPDMTKQITIEGKGIYVTDASGGNKVLIGSTDLSSEMPDPRWSPDGTKIALSQGSSGRKQIYVVDADGGNLTNISNNDRHDYLPYWSPDGTRIAFTSFKSNTEVYVMDADGGNQTNLTDYPGVDYLSMWSPQGPWSPDGQRVLFLSYRSGNADILSVDVDGSNTVNLTESVDSEESPVWSPDGTWIAYMVGFEGDGGRIFYDIFVMHADGTNQENLTNSPSVSDQNPFWIGGVSRSVSAIEAQTWGQIKSAILGNWR